MSIKLTDRDKYELVQSKLSKKLKKVYSNKDSAYNEAILCAKSIVKEVYGLPERGNHSE